MDVDGLSPPSFLTTAQRAVWDEAIAAAPEGHLQQADGSVLLGFVIAATTRAQAAELMRRSSGAARVCYCKLAIEELCLMRVFADHLGYWPARPRIVGGAQ